MKTTILVTLLVLSACSSQGQDSQKPSQPQIKVNLSSQEASVRRMAIREIEEKRLEVYVPNLKEIIYNSKYTESEKYLASRALANILSTRVVTDIKLLLNHSDSIMQNCGLEALIPLLKKKYHISSSKALANTIIQILKTNPSKRTIKKSSLVLGLMKYRPAYPLLFSYLQNKTGVFEEVIVSLALLGNAKRNGEIHRVFQSLTSRIRDKRLLRSLKKGFYILHNNNKQLAIFNGRMLDRLSDLGSDHFVLAFEAENYFRLSRSSTQTLKDRFGGSETFDPQKIRLIEISRIPLLTLALKDNNPKIRFKAVKLLGEVGSASSCKSLLDFYNTNKQSKPLAEMALISLAKLNCRNSFKLFLESEPKRWNSPLFIYIQKNPSILHTHSDLFLQYPLLFAQKELLPKDLSHIFTLLSHHDKWVRVRAIYSLYHSPLKRKLHLLKEWSQRESDSEVKDFYRSLMRLDHTLSMN